MMFPVVITEMEPEHVNAVYAISEASFPLPWAKEELIREIINPRAINLVALHEGTVCGYIQCWYTYEDADILNVAVNEDFKRQGIAKALLSRLIFMLKEKNVQNIFLEVRVSNIPAQMLYRSLGFITLAKRERYYINGEDALVMNLQI